MRTDQFDVHLVSETGRDCGLWTGVSGGDVDSSEASARDAYGLPRIQLGGPRTVTNMTLTRTFRLDRDVSLLPYLESGAGRVRYGVNVVALDPDGTVVANIRQRTGIVKTASLSDIAIDTDGSEKMTISVEISVDGP